MVLKRIDILFVDLDNTLWDGILGENSIVDIPIYRIEFLKELSKRGIVSIVLTNNPNTKTVTLKINNIINSKKLFAGICYCSNPKIICAQRILSRLSIPWEHVAIVDDDEVIRKDFIEYNALTFESFYDLMKFDWSQNNPFVSKRSVLSRQLIRKIGIDILNFKPDINFDNRLYTYLKRNKFKISFPSLQSEEINRIAELFYRTTQMQFNKSYFDEHDFLQVYTKIDNLLLNKGQIYFCSLSIKKLNLGIQGALLYILNEQINEVIVLNAAFSCSIMPFKVVEILTLSSFINLNVRKKYIINFKTHITDKNKRVDWLLNDLGGEKISNSSYIFKNQINIDKQLDCFIDNNTVEPLCEGVPPISLFYDESIKPILILQKNIKLFDAGSGFGEILGSSRWHEIKNILEMNNSKLLQGDIEPKQESIINTNVEDLNVFQNNEFDIIFCLELLEHVEHPNQAVFELLRVLKTNGLLFFSVPGISYPYHAFGNDYSRFSFNFLNSLFKKFGTIKKKLIQKYSDSELRSIILFQKESDVKRDFIDSHFSRHLCKDKLPSSINFYD